jgi:hypothetical protein
VAGKGDERKVYKVLVGKPEVERPLGRSNRTLEDEIRISWGDWLRGMEWIQVAQDRK